MSEWLIRVIMNHGKAVVLMALAGMLALLLSLQQHRITSLRLALEAGQAERQMLQYSALSLHKALDEQSASLVELERASRKKLVASEKALKDGERRLQEMAQRMPALMRALDDQVGDECVRLKGMLIKLDSLSPGLRMGGLSVGGEKGEHAAER